MPEQRTKHRFEAQPDFEQDPKTKRTIYDKSDAKQYFRTQDARLREKWVDVAQAKILQERITECYLRESVNHLEACKPLVKQYFSLIQQPTFGIRKQGGAPHLEKDTWSARFRG
mmetsp:Transcript_42208/g.61891  ORF Transcript_42208/g.61891 Transcript_42208/m.61891 type:complete len:114 (+) Transcript_42208:104-445(+)|eukprot:CAMPEP_0195517840 /NCGR_PEP_ID=MMETSP0794_2-20130614/11782_1 /TAXON_ID=515487 /ORGANISM="Stephanopyxis turris, Strain CCMP 815" /LENGTH=113 /DNA_ID=CAMNT_0040646713 /DNA_START=104 /DNA_END=445 /DNA_ORIENTATION=-